MAVSNVTDSITAHLAYIEQLTIGDKRQLQREHNSEQVFYSVR